MENTNNRRIRLMILCWGYSIHARRRAQLFIDDDRFDVTVVSTYPYELEGADNILLGTASAANNTEEQKKNKNKKFGSWIPAPIRVFLKSIFKIVGIFFELKRMRSDLTTLRDAVKLKQPDVILLQTLQYPSFLAYLLPAEIPMAVTFWNGDLTYFAKWTGLEMLIKKKIVVHGLKRVQAITVNSQTAYDAGVKLGADPKKMTLVRYPGADLNRFKPRDKQDARKRLGVSSRFVILCPRGLGDFFNSDVIVEAVAKAAITFPDLLIVFISGVGGEEEWQRHLKMAANLGIKEKMRWDGQIAWEEMPYYYAAADIMVSVKTADSCPNCMLESMACGIPVVMSDTQQNREWINDGVNGFLCPPRDADIIAERIKTLLDNQGNLIDNFSSICLEKVQKDANSEINISIIKKLVSSLASPQAQKIKT